MGFSRICRFAVIVGIATTLVPTIAIVSEMVLTARGMPMITGVVERAIGTNICHHLRARTISIGTVAMPVCARCAGLYLGCVAGTLLGLLLRVRQTIGRGIAALLRWSAVALLAAVALAAAEALGWIATSNPARLALGLPLGFAPSIAIAYAARLLHAMLAAHARRIDPCLTRSRPGPILRSYPQQR